MLGESWGVLRWEAAGGCRRLNREFVAAFHIFVSACGATCRDGDVKIFAEKIFGDKRCDLEQLFATRFSTCASTQLSTSTRGRGFGPPNRTGVRIEPEPSTLGRGFGVGGRADGGRVGSGRARRRVELVAVLAAAGRGGREGRPIRMPGRRASYLTGGVRLAYTPPIGGPPTTADREVPPMTITYCNPFPIQLGRAWRVERVNGDGVMVGLALPTFYTEAEAADYCDRMNGRTSHGGEVGTYTCDNGRTRSYGVTVDGSTVTVNLHGEQGATLATMDARDAVELARVILGAAAAAIR